MIKSIITAINRVIKEQFNIAIISQDIDKNTIFPCFKVGVIDYSLDMVSRNFFKWNITIAINYYPKLNLDKTLEFINIKEKLSNILVFGIGNFNTVNIDFNNDEDFLTATVDFDIGIVYENEKGVGMEDIPYEIIKEIKLKLNNKED